MRIKWITGIVLVFALCWCGGMGLFFQPPNFPKPSYSFRDNPLSAEKIRLGRVLFFDPVLSADGSTSCATCHSPYNAFAHTDHALSHGIADRIGKRNAPALFNLAWNKSFMWDGAIHHLDLQALAPISHPDEMGGSLTSVLRKLSGSPTYRQLFQDAWGDPEPSGERLLKSLAQFQLTLVSANSRYDQMKSRTVQFNKQEQHGYQLFKIHCNRCHSEPLFSNGDFADNGLAVDPLLNDSGQYRITKIPTDSLKFKIPSLRNLAFTFPYMHDGRFRNLHEVLRHYSSGIVKRPGTDSGLKQGLTLSSNDRADLTAFLLTLTDTSFVLDPSHRDLRIYAEGKQ